jgi:Asp-tRNA(Asn)/Glu-tRNA(Gln) amidotransferase A subunit family amidase
MNAVRLLELMRAREVSPVEACAAYLRRAEELNPSLNAIVTFAPDVLDAARAAERTIMRGADVPSLCGLPITIKDTIATRGLRTTGGTRLFAAHVPGMDAPAVERLRRAGAIILGKTNASELALDYESENPVFGRTNNPHDLTRTPGGSSGGAAASVAARLSACDVGSDLAGSIRIPAHFCGIYGLLPTAGRVPNAGHFPPPAGPMSAHETFGPVARCVDDLTLMFSVLANEPGNVELNRDEPALRACRFAWYTDDGVAPVTTETKQAVAATAQALRAAGLLGVAARPPGVERAPELWLAFFARAVQRQMCAMYAGREELAGPSAQGMLQRGADEPRRTLDDYLNVWFERDRLRAELLAWMETTPLVVAPVGSVPAFPHGALKVSVDGRDVSTWRAFSYAQTFNVFGLPAVSVPVARSTDGLPIGVQIVGRPHAEREVLTAARVVEATLGGWYPPQLALPTSGHNPL